MGPIRTSSGTRFSLSLAVTVLRLGLGCESGEVGFSTRRCLGFRLEGSLDVGQSTGEPGTSTNSLDFTRRHVVGVGALISGFDFDAFIAAKKS